MSTFLAAGQSAALATPSAHRDDDGQPTQTCESVAPLSPASFKRQRSPEDAAVVEDEARTAPNTHECIRGGGTPHCEDVVCARVSATLDVSDEITGSADSFVSAAVAAAMMTATGRSTPPPPSVEACATDVKPTTAVASDGDAGVDATAEAVLRESISAEETLCLAPSTTAEALPPLSQAATTDIASPIRCGDDTRPQDEEAAPPTTTDDRAAVAEAAADVVEDIEATTRPREHSRSSDAATPPPTVAAVDEHPKNSGKHLRFACDVVSRCGTPETADLWAPLPSSI
ncbi:hypothetical protein NESM_000589400 [Novymonas esmeraldas]|uniref:Uncharacterized protein n=1 Tax=Novymonas esmeraldas TaxID=1808958 RepID=A0AAW0EQV5_9TRYP